MKVLSPILAQLLSVSFLRQSYAFQAYRVNLLATTTRGVSTFMSRDGEVEKVNGSRPGSDNNIRPVVESLLSSTMNRAMSTLSTDSLSEQTSTSKKNVSKNDVIDAAVVRATDQIKKEEENSKKEDKKQSTKKPKDTEQSYLQNASVTPTALGHTLWQQVIQPYKDIVVDATAGNGKDSLVLAQMLFPNNDLEHIMDDTADVERPRLICIDIQKEACENTFELLGEHLPDEIIENHIEVLHQSHAPMPSLPKESAGLVCYNLGYLPGVNKKSFQTQMMTSIYSIADSALLIRKGGLLSVMSYPGNGWKEHCAVNYFMEGLAMFTTRNEGGWRAYVDSIPTDYELEEQHMKFYGGDHESVSSTEEISVRETVRLALERVKADGAEKQTWRVFDHRPLGRPLSPILFTGMRIK